MVDLPSSFFVLGRQRNPKPETRMQDNRVSLGMPTHPPGHLRRDKLTAVSGPVVKSQHHVEVNTQLDALIRTTGCTTKCRSSGRRSKSCSSAAPVPKRCYQHPVHLAAKSTSSYKKAVFLKSGQFTVQIIERRSSGRRLKSSSSAARVPKRSPTFEGGNSFSVGNTSL